MKAARVEMSTMWQVVGTAGGQARLLQPQARAQQPQATGDQL